ncbi:MAG TPA: alpha/beta fold hydrolase, partial [Solirubrobacteraceae bacterium]|nr:alpha/beta fold hydrolase [Solirubrobacteraceae bacterium]
MTSDRRAGPFELHVEPPEGDGELLVLVHGGWTDTTTWARLVPSLTRSFAVVRYDRRGHSRSPRGLLPPTRRQHEDDLAALLERFDRGPAHLAGTSYGGAIALGLAGRRPDLVRSVVAHEPVVDPIAPGVAALFASVAAQIAAGDAAAATRRFFEVVILGPGGWGSVPEPVRRAAIGNARTFADMLADPAWAALDAAAV